MNNKKKNKIVIFAIRSLCIGGAEKQFINLVKNIEKNNFDIYVITMYGGGLESEITLVEKINYINMNKKSRYDFNFFFRYKKLMSKINPDVIYSFLGEMNLFSYWCKPKRTKIIWGFRASNMDYQKYGRLSQLLFYLQKIYSKKVDKIIANSYASIEFHKKYGFDMSKAVVIHNGIDTEKFKRNEKKRVEFRKKYGLKESDIAIGIVARIDEMKGYPVLAKASVKLFKEFNNIKIFAIGDGNIKIKDECKEILGKYNNTRFVWLGKQKNVENFYSGFDIYVSSSFGEGFSNSIAEAMACEVPCVVTDVGDSKIIVGDAGVVVKPRSEESLCEGIKKMINQNIKELGQKARERIIENFSNEKMVKKTEMEILKCAE